MTTRPIFETMVVVPDVEIGTSPIKHLGPGPHPIGSDQSVHAGDGGTATEAQTDTEAFRKWFSDSKVVDENGDPLVVYHGTANEFEAFEDTDVADNNAAGDGFYFTTSRTGAETYASPGKHPDVARRDDELIGDNPRVIDAYLNIEKPFTHGQEFSQDEANRLTSYFNNLSDENFRLREMEVSTSSLELRADLRLRDRFGGNDEFGEAIQSLGYDGYHFPNASTSFFGVEEGSQHWVAYEPNQIKSTDNVGTFDPNDPDITKHGGPGPHQSGSSQDVHNSGGGGGGGGGGESDKDSEWYEPDPTLDADGDGIADASRVGVPGNSMPPPPPIKLLPKLKGDLLVAAKKFNDEFAADPDGMARRYREMLANNELGDGPNIFNTDDAKMLSSHYSESLESRAKYNVAVHNTANALAKRAFSQHMDEVVSKMPEQDRLVLVTAGGVAAGKGFAVSNNPDVRQVKDMAAAIWDSAGEQNSTELPWVAAKAKEHGSKMHAVLINSDPKKTWVNDQGWGAVQRAKEKGRMVDARLHSESYPLSAKNFDSFSKNYAANDETISVDVIDTTTGGYIRMSGVPPTSLSHDANVLRKEALQALFDADVPDWVKSSGAIGETIWGSE